MSCIGRRMWLWTSWKMTVVLEEMGTGKPGLYQAHGDDSAQAENEQEAGHSGQAQTGGIGY